MRNIVNAKKNEQIAWRKTSKVFFPLFYGDSFSSASKNFSRQYFCAVSCAVFIFKHFAHNLSFAAFFLLFNRMTVHLTCACKRLLKIDKQHGEECGALRIEKKTTTHFCNELKKWADRYTVSHGGSFFSFSCYHVCHCFPFITCVKSSRTIENL